MISRRLAIATALSLGLHSALVFSLLFWKGVSAEISNPSTLSIRLTGSESGLNSKPGNSVESAYRNLAYPDASSESSLFPPPPASTVGADFNSSPPSAQSPPSTGPSSTLPTPIKMPAVPAQQSIPPPPASLSGLAAPAIESEPSYQSASPLSIPKPNYPLLARRRGLEGAVLIELDIDASGDIKKFEFIPPRSSPLLEKSVLTSLENLVFAPATSYGQPVQSTLSLKFRFELED